MSNPIEDKMINSLNQYLLRFIDCENRKEHLNILSDPPVYHGLSLNSVLLSLSFMKKKKYPALMFKFSVIEKLPQFYINCFHD